MHDPVQLKSRIDKYSKQSKKKGSREQIRRQIYAVLMPPSGDRFAIPHSGHPIKLGTPLYRARKLSDPSEMKVESDVWNAPPQFVGPGRLNVDGESLLYTAVAQASTAAYEVRAKAGDLVAMSEYRTIQPFSALRIGDEYLPEGLTLKGEKKLRMIMQFMSDIFTQRTAPDTSHKYVAPELITKEFYDLPPGIFKAWSYTSIADPSGYGWNLCFRPAHAKQLIEYVSTKVVKIHVDPASGGYTFHHEVHMTLVKDQHSDALVSA